MNFQVHQQLRQSVLECDRMFLKTLEVQQQILESDRILLETLEAQQRILECYIKGCQHAPDAPAGGGADGR